MTDNPQRAGSVVFAYDGSDLAKAAIAEAAGVRAQSRAVQSAPTWKGIGDFADEHDASIIVLCSTAAPVWPTTSSAVSPLRSPRTHVGPC